MKALRIVLILLLCSLLAFASCQNGEGETSAYSPISVAPAPENMSDPEENSQPANLDSFALAMQSILDNGVSLKTSFSSRIDKSFMEKIAEKFGSDTVEQLATALESGVVTGDDLFGIIGYTEKAFLSILDDELDRTTVLKDTENRNTDLVFVGDVSFADGYSVMNYYNKRGKGVEGLVSEEVLSILRSATVAMANNEFTLTTRGKPIPDKIWTFRGKPENVSIYYEMGVDIVGLANNHAFDYGPDSLTDTLDTLDKAGIARLGAGENLEEAKAPYYYIVNGIKIAIVAGSAIDPYSTRGARENQSGVFQIFDTVSMSREITAAKEKADYVIAYVHWGHENTTVLTGGQKSMGKAFVDAGADVVIGMHSHCMQGAEYYKGKLIVYSLGNFTFSSKNLTCSMLKTTITPEGQIINRLFPMMQERNFTYINSGEKGESQLALLRSLLINAEISDDYEVTVPQK
ncbi:MAG: CapA family protein [Clostridia bacterium]|nr:CapA family protein [Clostridia bacterium]